MQGQRDVILPQRTNLQEEVSDHYDKCCDSSDSHRSKGAYRREHDLHKEVGKWGGQAEKAGGGDVFEMKSRSLGSRSCLVDCCVMAIAPEGVAHKANAQTYWGTARGSGWV